jgi:serine/threonine protein kinase
MTSGRPCKFWRLGVLSALFTAVLISLSDLNRQPVVIKRAPPNQFKNEIGALHLCHGSPYIRQLIDTSDDPPSMILERLDTSLYAAACQEKLERRDIKQAAKAALRGLALLHDHGIIHNGN